MKARKNQIERDGMRRAHIRDAVAVCDFLAHFEESVSTVVTMICCLTFLQNLSFISCSAHKIGPFIFIIIIIMNNVSLF